MGQKTLVEVWGQSSRQCDWWEAGTGDSSSIGVLNEGSDTDDVRHGVCDLSNLLGRKTYVYILL